MNQMIQRGQRLAALGLTSAAFQELVYTGKVLECQWWLATPESAFGLAGEAAARGLTNEEMVALVWPGSIHHLPARIIFAWNKKAPVFPALD